MVLEGFYEDAIFRIGDDFAKDIKCPTLIISSGADESVSPWHADMYLKNIGSKVKRMEIIKGSDHIYSGDALSKVCGLTAEWFAETLA